MVVLLVVPCSASVGDPFLEDMLWSKRLDSK